MSENLGILLQLLSGVLQRADQITALLNRANAEGRDVTDAELDSLAAEDDVSRIRLQDAIIKAKSG